MRANLPAAELEAAVREAHLRGCAVAAKGRVASYIPELAKSEPRHLGLAVQTLAGAVVVAGDVDQSFTLQSISKVFALASVMARGQADPFSRMSVEPSGDAFHSIVRLEEERGHPRNPFINAGAIAISDLFVGADAQQKFASLCEFLSACTGGEAPELDRAVYASECSTGFRNRALANYMRHFGVVDDPEAAVDAYFRQCSVRVSARKLARMGLFLANGGIDPLSGTRLVSAKDNRSLLALMTTCGLYDEVGRFAIDVGLPAKSGVSGGIMAIVPRCACIVVYGPALGPRGNSLGGMRALEHLADALKLSLFDN